MLQKNAARAAQLNFVQGAYARKTSLLKLSIEPEWQRLGIGLAAVFLLWIGSLYAFGWLYHRAAQDAWQAASNTYNRLFPDDTATVMLESQFRRRLAGLQSGAADQDFLSSLAMVEKSFDPQSSGWVAKRLSYDERDRILNLDLEAKQYEQLEQLQKRLTEQGAVADIANYRNQGEAVSARIRLSAGVTP